MSWKLMGLVVAMVVSGVGVGEAASNCSTAWNALMQRYETRCSDGTSALESYNPLMRRWETDISRPSSTPWRMPQQHCQTVWNALMQRVETRCN